MVTPPWSHGRLRVSENHRRLVHDDGTPFFWLGDTAWELFHRLTLEEIETYLDARARWGVNVVQAVGLAEFDGLRVPNRYGDLPLIDEDPTRLNPGYWDLVDDVVVAAAQRGMYVGLLPTWGDKINQDWGAGPVVLNEENAFEFTRQIAARLVHRPNVIWINGGDRDPKDRKAVYDAMGRGLLTSATPRLMTFHPCGGRSSSMDFHDADWLDMNMQQSGHGNREEVPDRMMAEDWAREPHKPVLDGEPRYESHAPFEDGQGCHMDGDDARKAAYMTVFRGACGVTYGCHAVWQFASPSTNLVNRPLGFWKDSMDLPGIRYYGLLKDLMLSLPFVDLLPAPHHVVGASDDPWTGPRTLATGDGAVVAIYLPQGGAVTLAPAGARTVQWFNPRNGSRSAPVPVVGDRIVSPQGTSQGLDYVALLRTA